MKLSFSTKDTKASRFAEVCNIACDYGFQGFEIYDIKSGPAVDSDGPFNSVNAAGAKRKLVNRHLSVSALVYPNAVGKDKSASEEIRQYIEEAGFLSVQNVIVTLDDEATLNEIKAVLDPVMPLTEQVGVTLLFETAGK